jgi:hypothetical protein
MRSENYGRVVMTTSSSGLYGNFGQSNYGAAKMALVGLMQTLANEGEKNGIRVNCLAPSAATAMTHGILEPDVLARLDPALVSPGLIALVASDAPTRTILLAGAGSFEAAHITMTRGIFVANSEDPVSEIRARSIRSSTGPAKSFPWRLSSRAGWSCRSGGGTCALACSRWLPGGPDGSRPCCLTRTETAVRATIQADALPRHVIHREHVFRRILKSRLR